MAAKRIEVRAPMSGIFYCSPSPDDPPYVALGDTVKKKQVKYNIFSIKYSSKYI